MIFNKESDFEEALIKILSEKRLSFALVPFFVTKDKIIKIHNDKFHIVHLLNKTI